MARRAETALLGAVFAVGLLVLTWYLAFHVSFAQSLDMKILAGFTDLHRPRVDPIANFIARLCNPQPYVFLVAGVLLIALARRRPGLALVIGGILLGANVTTHLLKPLLAASRAGLTTAASWPSGHATAAMSFALCLVLAAPGRWRPVAAAFGAAFAVAVSYSFLTLGWHYPSDVLGGYLVATTWTLLGVALLFAMRQRRAVEPSTDTAQHRTVQSALRAPTGLLLAAVGAGALVFLVWPHQVVSYAQGHRAFVLGAGAIAIMGVGLATGLMLALRR